MDANTPSFDSVGAKGSLDLSPSSSEAATHEHLTHSTTVERLFQCETYLCTHCEREFENCGKLKRHLRTHTGERHRCTVCDKSYINSGELVIHMRSHTGEKPYPCKVCDKRFTSSKRLKVHSITHTGERSFSCAICHKTFAHKHVLKLHTMSQHMSERFYTCKMCPEETFKSKKEQEKHLKSHIGNVKSRSSMASALSDSTSPSSDDEDQQQQQLVTSIQPLPAQPDPIELTTSPTSEPLPQLSLSLSPVTLNDHHHHGPPRKSHRFRNGGCDASSGESPSDRSPTSSSLSSSPSLQMEVNNEIQAQQPSVIQFAHRTQFQ